MAGIPLGEFGFRAPQQPTGQVLNPAAYQGGGDGLRAIGQALESAAGVLYKREAMQYSRAAIHAGKQGLDTYEVQLRQRQKDLLSKAPRLPDGTVDLDGFEQAAMKDFDEYSSKLLEQSLKGTKNRDAVEATSRDLQNYTRAIRDRVFEQVGKQKQQIGVANLMESIETAKALPIDPAEKKKRIGETLGVAVESGIVAIDKAQEMRTKAVAEIEYATMFDEVAATNSLSQAYEMRGKYSRFNPALSPAQNREIRSLVDDRIKALDKETETSVKARQDDLAKMLMVRASEGKLTREQVLLYQNDLPRDQFEKFLLLPDIAAKRVVEGADNPELYRRTQKRLIDAANRGDARELNRLSAEIGDYMTGYDPVTKSYGTPALSRSTANQMLGDIQGNLGRIQSDANRQKGDVEQRQNREYEDVRKLLRGAIEGYKAGRIGRGAQAEADALGQRAEEELLKNRGNALKWWEDWKKNNATVFERKAAIPSWVTQSGGKPDFEATRKRLLADKKAGRLSESDYRNRFDKLEEMERANVP
jgi:hypothetical protein